MNGLDKPHDILNHLSYSNLSSAYKAFILAISTHFEPKSFHQAIQIHHWSEAMASKILALVKNNTWLLTHLSTSKTTIGCKWVYKIKYKSDGSIKRYKTRLVAKDYTQQKRLDYLEMFSFVAKMVTVKCLLS